VIGHANGQEKPAYDIAMKLPPSKSHASAYFDFEGAYGRVELRVLPIQFILQIEPEVLYE